MPTEGSLNRTMDRAKKHYSSLFFLPSFKKSLLSNVALTAIGITLTAYALFPSVNSLLLGLTLFAITLAADLVMSKALLRNDLLFTLRRTSAMSFYCWLLWLAFATLGTVFGFLIESILWIKLVLIGYGAVLTLRIIVLSATSYVSKWRQLVAALLQPILCVVAFLAFWSATSVSIIPLVFPYAVLTPIVAYTAVYVFLQSVDKLGKTSYGLPAMSFFRAFILNWVTGANEQLEKHLEEVGQDIDISVSLIKFDAAKPKAAIIMPLVHPGPFKNIGSSLLPSMLKHDFEKAYGCDTCTPLGVLGHELDLASQAQNRKIVAEVLKQANFPAAQTLASPFVRSIQGDAIASCQVFGDTAFLSFSTAPKTTEDLPQELGRIVTEEARRGGLKHAMVVNAHNALADDSADMSEHMDELKHAAFDCLSKALSFEAKPFRVGAATVYPAEFTEKMGIGTGGITTILVEVEAQKTAYVVIDGNNMVPHLREKILAALTAAGFDEGEVFTTDTHAVSALVTGRRGYHPVGEVMDHNVLIRYVLEAAGKAAQNLEAAKSGCVEFVVPKVRVIGEERLNSISILVDRAISRAKKAAPAVFGVEGLLLVLLLWLF